MLKDVNTHERETNDVLQMSRVYVGRTPLYSTQSPDLRTMFELRVLAGSCRYSTIFSQGHCERAGAI